jgi:hypothetical protein
MTLAPVRRAHVLVLVLVSLSMLTIINPINVQDVTRISLSRQLAEHGTVDIDRYHKQTTDRAFRDGHWYSDKAPGVSLLAVPTVEGLRALDRAADSDLSRPYWKRVGHLWLTRILTAGIGFLLATFLLLRVADGRRAGYGPAVAVTFALGTLAGPLAPTMFGHDLAGGLAFAAFVIVATAAARTSRLVAAGALAGAAVLAEYQAALIAVILLVYVAIRHGYRSLAPFALGGVPFALGLGAYNWAAFGSPLHLSYNYVANQYTERQHEGFFGIGAPDAHGAWYVFFDGKGILLVSPVLVIAAAGLALLWRSGRRAEAGVCLAVTVAFLFAVMGYFDPYGGLSPGPRFFAPALPFLAVGLVEAYHRWPIPTGLLALWSISWTVYDHVAWALNVNITLTQFEPNTIFARLPVITTAFGYRLIFVCAALTTFYAAMTLVRVHRDEAAVAAVDAPSKARQRAAA